MKQYPDYKYKPRRKPKNPLTSSTPTNLTGNLPLHNQTNLHQTASSPTTAAMNLNNMVTNLQNGTNTTAAAALAAIQQAVASQQDSTQSTNPLSAQNLLTLGQNLNNAFNLRDFPVSTLFPGMNNAALAALTNASSNSQASSQANSISQPQYGFNSSILGNSFLNPIYSSAKQTQLLNTLNCQKKSSISPTTSNNHYSNRTTSPVYSSPTNNNPTAANLLQLSSNNDAYLAALHQQFLLNQQQQLLMTNSSSQQQQQYSPADNEALSNYFNNTANQLKQNALSIDNLVKKHQQNGIEKDDSTHSKNTSKSSKDEASDDETIEDHLDDEEDGDYNEEISNLLEKKNQKDKDVVGKEDMKRPNGQVSLKRSIDSVLNERTIDNNNNNNNDFNDKKNHHSDQPTKHFKSSNGGIAHHTNDHQFESNDLKLSNNLTNNLTSNLFNTLQRTYNLSPNSALIDNMKRFFSRQPTTSPITSLNSSKASFTENYSSLTKSSQHPFATMNNDLANQTSNHQQPIADTSAFLSSLKPHLIDYNASTASNFLEFYSQLLFKQANGRSNTNDTNSFDLHSSKSSLIL